MLHPAPRFIGVPGLIKGHDLIFCRRPESRLLRP